MPAGKDHSNTDHEPEVCLEEVSLGRVVGVPSLCRDVVDFFNSTGWAFYVKLA